MSDSISPKTALPGVSRKSVAVVVITLALLSALVWFLNPSRPSYKPAPLDPPSPVCDNPGRAFVPGNLIEISDPLLDALPQDQKKRAIFSLNMTACSCGCNLSVAVCRRNNEMCETSRVMLSKTVSGAGKVRRVTRPQ